MGHVLTYVCRYVSNGLVYAVALRMDDIRHYLCDVLWYKKDRRLVLESLRKLKINNKKL